MVLVDGDVDRNSDCTWIRLGFRVLPILNSIQFLDLSLGCKIAGAGYSAEARNLKSKTRTDKDPKRPRP